MFKIKMAKQEKYFADIEQQSFLYNSDVFKYLIKKENSYDELNNSEYNHIALFDLDNTLLYGDIGDAVFAHLIINGIIKNMSWKDYIVKRKNDPIVAYIDVVKAMQGISLDHIIQITKKIIESDLEYVLCEGELVKLPKPNPIMQEIIKMLRNLHYSVFIVSASNDISAKIVGSILFDVPINNIAGIKPKLDNNYITPNILEPIPVGIGKIAQYRLMANDRMPTIVATDSELDLPMLHLCKSDGMVILVGDDDKLYKRTKKELGLTVNIFRIKTNHQLLMNTQVCVG